MDAEMIDRKLEILEDKVMRDFVVSRSVAVKMIDVIWNLESRPSFLVNHPSALLQEQIIYARELLSLQSRIGDKVHDLFMYPVSTEAMAAALERRTQFAAGQPDLSARCPECDGENLNEDATICFDCSAADYQEAQ